MGQWASGKAACRWARTCAAAGRRAGWCGRWGRGTACGQCRADFGLAQVEAFPEALPGSVAAQAVGGADRGGDAVGGGALEKLANGVGGQAQPPDFARAPGAESPPATGTRVAVAAKDSACAQGFSLGAAVVEPEQGAVPNQRARSLAERARRQLEPLARG